LRALPPWAQIRRTGVLAVKKGMLQMWDAWGVRMPITVLQARGRPRPGERFGRTPSANQGRVHPAAAHRGPQLESVQVTGVKTPERDGYWAVQLGARDAKPKNVNKPQLAVFQANNVPPKRTLQEFRISDADAAVPIGPVPALRPWSTVALRANGGGRPQGSLEAARTGTPISAAHFVPGQLVDVCGTT